MSSRLDILTVHMPWSLQRPKRPNVFLAPSGFDGEKESLQPLQLTIDSPQSNETPSSQFSLDPMTGLSLSNHHLMARSNLYCSFTQQDINEYIGCIRSKRDLLVKLQTVRSCMVEVEKCHALGILCKDEYAYSISKLSVLFKSLLMVKERYAISSV